jgi:alanyl-tRNA synthetase
MRRIIRRAARHGKELGYQPGFFSRLVDVFVPMMQEAYPEIAEAQDYIKILLLQEERRFSTTLNQGMKILEELLERYQTKSDRKVDGEEIFKLYDTYGFPVDLAEDVLQDNNLEFDRERFKVCMEEQRQRAKADQGNKKIDLKVNRVYLDLLEKGLGNSFVGYADLEVETHVSAIIKQGEQVDQLRAGDKVEVLLAKTPFYAEAGGQVGDTGEIMHDEFRIVVTDTQSPVAALNLCHGQVTSTTKTTVTVKKGSMVKAKVATEKRLAIQANHTATHLLQAALRTVLGDHVKQSGSLVNSEKLRFDFSHYAPVTLEQISDIESIINQRIRENIQVVAEEMEFNKAVATGAMAIFGEKYGDTVRVISAGQASKELCGGCHTSKTGNIGLLKVVNEESIAAGIRRIEAITGGVAIKYVQENLITLEGISQKLKVPMIEVGERLDQVLLQFKEKEKLVEHYQKELQQVAAERALKNVVKIGDTSLLMMKTDSDADLKSQAGAFLTSMKSGVVLLARIVDNSKISVILSVSRDLSQRINAGNLVRDLAPLIDARGGGSPNVAQCGGSKPEAWDKLQNALREKIRTLQ